jgi:hypothetical protein
MADKNEIARQAERLVNTHGAFLTGRFLDPDARPRAAWSNAIIPRAMYRNGAFAFWTTTSPVPAVQIIESAEVDDVEYVLIGEDFELRFVVLWYSKAEAERKSWLDDVGVENADRHLRDVTESVEPMEKPPEFGRAK